MISDEDRCNMCEVCPDRTQIHCPVGCPFHIYRGKGNIVSTRLNIPKYIGIGMLTVNFTMFINNITKHTGLGKIHNSNTPSKNPANKLLTWVDRCTISPNFTIGVLPFEGLLLFLVILVFTEKVEG